MHRQQQDVRTYRHALRACRYGGRHDQRARQVSVVHEVVLREPDAPEPEPLGLLDLLEALRVEPRVVPERRSLPEVVPEPESRSSAVCGQYASPTGAYAPSLHPALALSLAEARGCP